MVEQLGLGCELFAALAAIDEKIMLLVAAGRCPPCGGPLNRSDYGRKPRGALLALAGEAFVTRFSLCCGREGYRNRAMPPSLRFLGRRVYLDAVIIVASTLARMTASAVSVSGSTLPVPR